MQSFIATTLFAIGAIGAVSAAPAPVSTPAQVAPNCVRGTWDADIHWCQPSSCSDGGPVMTSKDGSKLCECISAAGLYWNNYSNECRNRLNDVISGTYPKGYPCPTGYVWSNDSRMCNKA